MIKSSGFYTLIFILLYLFFPIVDGLAAITYIPPIKNYSTNDYRAGNQNWAVNQGSNGWIFIGNNKGLLQFDGIRWHLHKLPNNNAVRSLYIDANDRIYVGSFEEFGFFEIDDKGLFQYTSLKDSITGYNFNNDEIWTINESAGRIYFQSFSSFFVYDGKSVIEGKSEKFPFYFFSLNGELYAQFQHGGFCIAKGDEFEELVSRESLNGGHVVAVLPLDNQLLLITAMNGLYRYSEGEVRPWKAPIAESLKSAIANRAVMLSDSTYVVGTISNGLIAFDKDGRLVWQINRNNKLINNTILGLFSDSSDNLWAACDNGVAYIQTNAAIKYADFSGMDLGMVHDMVIDRGNLYLATNQGVYSIMENTGQPKMIPGSEEQSWYISKEDNRLFVGHNRGTLIIRDGQVKPIPGDRAGGTVMKRCVIYGQEILLQASYSVLSVFIKNEKGEWIFSHDVEGFINLIKSFEVDFMGNIWASHMHKGLYRIQLDNSLRKVKETEYIGKLAPENREGIIHVMKLKGRILFTDGNLFYTYDDMSRKIIPYKQMNEQYASLANSYRIVEVDNDQYWFVSDFYYALMTYEGETLKLSASVPFSMLDNPPIETRGNVYVDNGGNTYFCLNGGFAVYSYNNPKTDFEKKSLALTSVKVSARSHKQSYSLPLKPTEPIEIGYNYNDITFDFYYPNYEEYALTIRYKLDGFESEWTNKQAAFSKIYSNLPYGNYRLEAEAYDSNGVKVSGFSYPFKIKPPFYQSIYAYSLYLLLIFAFLILLIRFYVRWELAREKKRVVVLRQQQEEQLKAQEQLIMKLEKEKLEDELTYKSKELASATLSVISQNEFLEQLKAEVQEQKLSGKYSKAFFDKLIRMINDNITKESDWAVFQTNFDRIHEKFFVKLKSRYPELTSGDLRMCALLRLNMPTKDMASMLSLSVRGVEAARYRLRKKLNLAEGESLTDFVLKFE